MANRVAISFLSILSGCQTVGEACDEPGFVVVGEASHFVEDGPWIQTIELAPATITADDDVIVSAQVCHPDGSDSSTRVELRSLDLAVTYGSLAREDRDWVLRSSWDELDAAATITFVGPLAPLELAVWADDGEGREGWRETALELRCDAGGACDGECRSLVDDPENCGVCGGRCIAIDQFVIGPVCAEGLCVPALSSCRELPVDWTPSCNQICSNEHGESCAASACAGQTGFSYESLAACEAFDAIAASVAACTDEVALPAGSTHFRCCCEDYP